MNTSISITDVQRDVLETLGNVTMSRGAERLACQFDLLVSLSTPAVELLEELTALSTC